MPAGSQCSPVWKTGTISRELVRGQMMKNSLNVVRSGRPEQLNAADLAGDSVAGLNVVRSGRPEQLGGKNHRNERKGVSQCSPVWKTGTIRECEAGQAEVSWSQCSPVWKTGTIVPVRRWHPPESIRLNVVRSGRPEQLSSRAGCEFTTRWSSQCSPVWKTGTIPCA